MRMNEIESFFKNAKNNKLVLFGASNYGTEMLRILEKKRIRVDYFCDNDESKHGSYFNGIKVISLDELIKIDINVNILITSIYYKEIYDQIKLNGFNNIYCFSIKLNNKNDGEFVEDNCKDIKKCYEILSDEKSKLVFNNLLEFRKSSSLLYLKDIIDKNQYFEPEIIEMSNEEIFIDGGAYTGDTIEEFINLTNNKFDSIYSFEPDKDNFNKLMKYVNKRNTENVYINNLGLYNKNDYLNFNSNGNVGSNISINGNDTVEVISLDEYFENKKVSFIKMDIEGSEKEALQGAQNIIRKYKPKLAICIYHKPEDLWEIPLYLKSLVNEYKIYIRHYGRDWNDTICYAIV
jgi:methyltransferase, FkbM family